MKHYSEPAKQIPVVEETDVLVAGGGPAGIAAAIAAARQGCKTILVEQAGDVGGVATTGMMSHWTGETRGGLYEELLDRSRDDVSQGSRQTINPEKLKNVLLKMLSEAGVQIRTYTFASDTILEDNCVKGIVTESKSGREAIFSKVVIDCTGDGDVAAKAGAAFYKGREDDGSMQPVTLMFKVAGVNDKFPNPGRNDSGFGQRTSDSACGACTSVSFHDSRSCYSEYDKLYRCRRNQCKRAVIRTSGLPDADGRDCGFPEKIYTWL